MEPGTEVGGWRGHALSILPRIPGIVLRIVVLLLGVGAAACFYVYLPGNPLRLALAAGAILAGLLLTGLVHLLLTRGVGEGPARFAVPLVLLGILMAFPLSMFWPGQVLYARFGLTVYGIVPVPALDIVITEDGVLWFREKSHRITKEEVAALLGDAPEAVTVVIAIGWDEVAVVEPEVHMLPVRSVLIVRTGEALDLYNRLKREGRPVVLLAHTTC